MSQPSTYIGIAFLTADGYPHQSAIVLSTHMQFDDVVLSGTVIESVNGRVVSWKHSPKSPPSFEQYLRLVGVITVAKVNGQPSDIYESIKSLEWKVQDVRPNSNSLKEIYSNDYVCRALLDLCNKRIISLPSNMKNNLGGHITDGLGKLLRRPATRFNVYHVVSLEDEDTVFGRTRF
jgi:hypothetical protein